MRLHAVCFATYHGVWDLRFRGHPEKRHYIVTLQSCEVHTFPDINRRIQWRRILRILTVVEYSALEVGDGRFYLTSEGMCLE
jgi:hypothetical protein